MTSLWRHSRLTYYDLGHNFLTQCVELLPGEVWQVSKRNSQYFRSYLRKTTGGGPLGPPPSGARVKRYEKMYFSGILWVQNALPAPTGWILWMQLHPLAGYCGCSCTHCTHGSYAYDDVKINDVILRLWGFMVASYPRLNPILDVRVGKIKFQVMIYSRLSRL